VKTNILNISIVLVIMLVFSGCSNRIAFENFKTSEYAKSGDIHQKERIKLPLDGIKFHSLTGKVTPDNLKDILKYNKLFYGTFNTIEENPDLQVEIVLEEMGIRHEYVPSREYEYKGEIRYTDSYYNLVSYAALACKITHSGKTEIIRRDSSFTRRMDVSSHYYPRFEYYGYYNNYNEFYSSTINATFNKIISSIQREMMTPFKVIKVIEQIPAKVEKGKNPKIGLLLNGGTCDGLSSGMRVRVYDQLKEDIIARGEVTSDSSCKGGWVSVDEYSRKPQVFDIVH
jgi:hypothetical protein